MDESVEANLTVTGKLTTVAAGNLRNLLQDGFVHYDEAVAALKRAGIALDHKRFPWLRHESASVPEIMPEPEPTPELPDEAEHNSEGA